MSDPAALARELFADVQASQGYAFISDDDGFVDREEVLALARRSLEWTTETARVLRAFLRKHGTTPRGRRRPRGRRVC